MTGQTNRPSPSNRVACQQRLESGSHLVIWSLGTEILGSAASLKRQAIARAGRHSTVEANDP